MGSPSNTMANTLFGSLPPIRLSRHTPLAHENRPHRGLNRFSIVIIHRIRRTQNAGKAKPVRNSYHGTKITRIGDTVKHHNETRPAALPMPIELRHARYGKYRRCRAELERCGPCRYHSLTLDLPANGVTTPAVPFHTIHFLPALILPASWN